MTTFDTQTTPAFQLNLPVFEGPLDLLLHLIEREELDITAVALVQVTDQYLKHLRAGDQIDATALAEFIAIGARLLFLKSRALLPKPPVEDVEEELGDDLVTRLMEYKRFKEAAAGLQELQERGLRAFPRETVPSGLPLPTGLNGVTLDLLSQIMQEVLEKLPEEKEPEELPRHSVTVEEKIAELTLALKRGVPVSFRTFISACSSRQEIIVSFMAVLELIKGLQLEAEQDALFGDIKLVGIEVEAASEGF